MGRRFLKALSRRRLEPDKLLKNNRPATVSNHMVCVRMGYRIYFRIKLWSSGIDMRIRTAVFAFLANLAAAAGANAVTVTLDFTAPNQLIAPGTYAEDGFIVDGAGSPELSIISSSLVDEFFSPLSPDFFTITRSDGGLFSFISFDFSSEAHGQVSDEFQILGFSGGMQVADYGIHFSFLTTLVTIQTMNMTLVDELRIVSTREMQRGIHWDNFVFETSEIPLPAAFPLFIAGLAGLGVLGRRRRKKRA